MSRLPKFKTDRLHLRQRTLSDLPACLAMDRDPEVTRFVPGPWADPVDHQRFVEERIGTDFGEGLGYWTVVERERPGRFVGWILLIPYEGVGPHVEIGWRFVREAWGKGYATEAAQPVLNHALHDLGLSRIVAEIDPANLGSIRVASKIGMSDEGVKRRAGVPYRSFEAGSNAGR